MASRQKDRKDSSSSDSAGAVIRNISQNSSNFNTSGNGTRTSPTGANGVGPQSPLRRNRLRAATATGGVNLENFEGVPEDEVFMHILDLLEMQDEFDSSMASDRDSEVGDDLSSVASDLDEDEEEWDPRDESSWRLPPLDVTKAIQDLRQRRLPNLEVCKKILRSVIVHYAAQPNVIHVPAPEVGSRFVIVGDLHGHFGDLIHLLEDHGEPSAGPKGAIRFLFNGDFVDRGTWGPEVLLLLYALKIKFPTAVFLNRGNHEDQSQNQLPDNGFVHSHCTRAFGGEAVTMYHLCRRSFKELPLCHVIGGEVFVVHGGLPMDPIVTLSDINSIDRRHDVPIKHCALMGYPKGQKVIAKKDLNGKDGEKVFKGSKGRLCERVRKSNDAICRFMGGGSQDEVVVKISGAPELEEDVEIVYTSEKERQRQRQYRIFVALLWSDPVMKPSQRGPSKRGAGAFFDSKVTQEFLKVNKLKVLLRSHEKRSDGFSIEHQNGKGHMIAATVFSASNYPRGAGEPMGNKAAVVVMEPKEAGSLASSLVSWPAWRVGFTEGLMSNSKVSEEMKNKFQEAQAALTLGPRARALAKLRELTYCVRPQLLGYWQAIDTEAGGVLSREHWARGMRACVIADDDFPWEWLEPYMLKSLDLEFNYAVFLSQYGNSLARKLASRFYGGSMMSILPGVKTKADIEAAWNTVDRNGDGRLSYQELRPILRSASSGFNDDTDKITMEDHIYSLLCIMDRDKTGFVDREEFVSSMMGFLTGESLVETSFSMESFEGKPGAAPQTGRRSGCPASRGIEDQMSEWTDEEISQCLASTQGVIRALSTTTGCASAVFQVLDEDSDGAIDREEFRKGLRQLLAGLPVMRNMSKWEPLLWKLVDEDGSGLVSPHEMNLAFSVRETLSI
ncbi:PPEF2 [Symbiodinium natans]|uniref:Serine/threonine-protein phosphatase n=1 Tax=Symbiodinium natans TaxID=878477 RepID=A0A812TTA6_9DINO|nr:PPEF2 [Symbiodinium natans]